MRSRVGVGLLILLLAFLWTGCATFFSGTKEDVSIESDPPSRVTIDGERHGETPVRTELERGETHYVVFRKDGYEKHREVLESGFNATTLLNVVNGLLPGMAFDYLTDAANSVNPDALNVSLERDVSARPVANTEPARPEGPSTTDPGTTATESIVDTDIPETDMNRPNDIAVVVGIRDYEHKDVPDVDYALRDARTMKKYLIRTLGFREENIIFVENASGADMTRVFGTADDPEGQLYDWIKPDESDVFVYYSGHGAPNPESGTAYFVPSDTNPNYLSQIGYPVEQLYENLASLPANSVTVVLEACFSGVSDGGAVIQDVSPAVLSVENPAMGIENGLVLTAAQADQVSTWYNEKKHGLFTYYFLNGLRGESDANGDGAVTAKEMSAYLNKKVPYRAQRMHSRNQTPQMFGRASDRVLVRYE